MEGGAMTQDVATDEVLYEKRDDGVAVITLNRPERMNAMGGQLIPLLGKYVREAAWDDDVLCVVLTGNGRGFCAGADLRLGPGEEAAPGGYLEGVQKLMRIPYDLHTMHKPTVSVINGAAAGAGLGLALACDIKIMAASAKLTSAYRNVGLSGDFGAAYFLQKSIGYTRAIDLFFSAEVVTPQRALEIGLINRVLPDDRLRAKSLEYASWLAAGPAFAFARMKENFVAGEHADPRTVLQIESLNHNLSGRFRTGEQLRGFAEGRRPTAFSWD
jgi:2-(1,2-epoxy-1,2-dihydrophenyl)acetyl-CoA isomerase